MVYAAWIQPANEQHVASHWCTRISGAVSVYVTASVAEAICVLERVSVCVCHGCAVVVKRCVSHVLSRWKAGKGNDPLGCRSDIFSDRVNLYTGAWSVVYRLETLGDFDSNVGDYNHRHHIENDIF